MSIKKFCILFSSIVFLISVVSAQKQIPDFSEILNECSQKTEFIYLSPETAVSNPGDEFQYSVGLRYNVKFSLNEFKAEISEKGNKIYKIGFFSHSAKFMNISFSKFIIPENCCIYFYNPSKSLYYGPYTSKIQGENGFSSDLVEGDSIILLYYEPEHCKSNPDIRIRCIVAGQKAFFNQEETPNCLINTACEEAEPYRDIVQSIVLIYMDGYLCSGNLINNTALDARPYILTAAHCMENVNAANSGSWKFFFNIQSRSCNSNTDGPNYFDKDLQVITGCKIVASAYNSDFLLLELNEDVPEYFKAYFCGWDRRNVSPKKGVVGIHHPLGDYKKISISNQIPVTKNCGSIGYERMAFWNFFWEKGMAMQGSSGSGLFNAESKRLIGTLTAINDVECTEDIKYRMNWYGKLSYHWKANDENNNKMQLKPWLDPTGSNVLYIDGSYDPKSMFDVIRHEDNTFMIYPNPTSAEVNISIDAEYGEGRIFNTSGTLVKVFIINSKNPKINISELPEGFYIIQINTIKAIFRQKLLVTK